MPHLFFEYTDNLLEEPDIQQHFSSCHKLLAEIANADPKACKSRATKKTAYLAGLGKPSDAFRPLPMSLLA